MASQQTRNKGDIMITQDQVKELFSYRDGVLIRKTAPANSVNIGDVAGYIGTNGYLRICILGKYYLAHRIIFLMFNGYLPKAIDHIDGDKSNNKVENIRECTTNQNQYNAKLRKDNKSGYKGINLDKRNKMWHARIMVDGKRIHLGYFDDPEVAEKEVRIARIKYHGEFANHG